jgi:hypothetical protein
VATNKVRRLVADARIEQKYWRELANLVGWKVFGWTGMMVCDYLTDRKVGLLEICGSERDALVKAIKSGGRRARKGTRIRSLSKD